MVGDGETSVAGPCAGRRAEMPWFGCDVAVNWERGAEKNCRRWTEGQLSMPSVFAFVDFEVVGCSRKADRCKSRRTETFPWLKAGQASG